MRFNAVLWKMETLSVEGPNRLQKEKAITIMQVKQNRMRQRGS